MKLGRVLNLLQFITVTVSTSPILFERSTDSFALVSKNVNSVFLVDGEHEWPGVLKAANDLSSDFDKVTTKNDSLTVVNTTTSTKQNFKSFNQTQNTVIIAGTINKSSIISKLIEESYIDISSIEGKWESYIIKSLTVKNSTLKEFSGFDNAIIIAGSDKRGSIYGIYSISEQIGVSPWYWWTDTPIVSHSELHFIQEYEITSKEPSVKYRGIFLNDEEPALTGWLNAKFNNTGGKYTNFTHEFYINVFELLLRLKANFLWPTMWKAMFGLDDPDNQYWADYYGVVMSTSHTEPLQRASNEWQIDGDGSWDYTTNNQSIIKFWEEGIQRGKDYEGVWVEGMRGFGDRAMSDDVESSLLEEIIETQRNLLKKGFGNTTEIEDIPQTWCLYKEVQSYFQQGMKVPDDIILLWVDDNWGNIRRLPQGNESERVGGAGVYYHFDYVGEPRSYKWINTISLEKTWEQMHLAYQKNARKIWVVNVGDLKPLEIPINYFLDLAYDFDKWGQPNQVLNWTIEWSTRQFGPGLNYNSTLIDEVSDIIDLYGLYASRRKFELVNSTVYSLTYYQEAFNILNDWKDLYQRAKTIYNQLSDSYKPTFFQTVLHPVKAGYIVHDLYISAGKNEIYTDQGRNQASYLADHVRQTFKEDYKLKKTWDRLLGGKWEHFLDQTHLGYQYWQQPMRDTMPFVGEVLSLDTQALSGAAALTVDQSLGVVTGDSLYNAETYDNNTLVLPQLDPFVNYNRSWIEVFNRGVEDFDFELVPWNDYITFEPTTGSVSATNDSIWNSMFVNVDVDWEKAPEGWSLEYINFTTNVSTYFNKIPTILFLPLNSTKIDDDDFEGFVESGGYISIEADNFSRNVSQNDTYYITIDRYGRTKSGVTLFPVTVDSQEVSEDSSYLEYDFYSFGTSDTTNVSLTLSPSLNVNPYKPLRYAVALDDEEPQVVQVYEDATDPTAYPKGWELAVEQSAWIKNTTHEVQDAGKHTLKLWSLEPGVVFQKILIDFGGAVPSLLGPPQSYYRNN